MTKTHAEVGTDGAGPFEPNPLLAPQLALDSGFRARAGFIEIHR